MHSAIFRISFISSDLFSTKTVELTLGDAGVLSSQLESLNCTMLFVETNRFFRIDAKIKRFTSHAIWESSVLQ